MLYILYITQYKEDNDPFLLIGDTSPLYGLTGHPSIAPSLWFHPGLIDTRRFQNR